MKPNAPFWRSSVLISGLVLVMLRSAFAQPYAYTGGADAQVNVVEVTCGAVVDVITVGNLVRDVTANSHFTRVYTANQIDNTVTVIDSSDRTDNSVIETIPVGDAPLRLRVTPNDAELWVANFESSSISVIDTTSNTVTHTITKADGLHAGPAGIAFAPDGSVAYIPTFFNGQLLQVFDVDARTLVSAVSIGDLPSDVDISPDGLTLYVALGNTGVRAVSVSVTDPTDLALGTLVAAGSGVQGLSVSPDGSLVAVGTARSMGLHLIDTETNALVAGPGIGGSGAPSFTSEGSLLFIPGTGFNPARPSGAVTVHVASRTLVQSFQFGSTAQLRAAVSHEDPGDVDNDGDGMGDPCDPDDDNDGSDDLFDNCPFTANQAQEDNDGDGLGDTCDPTGEIDSAIAETVDILKKENPPGVKGLINRLAGNNAKGKGSVAAHLAAAEGAADAGDTSACQDEIHSALSKLNHLEAQLDRKIARGQIDEPAATDLQDLVELIETALLAFPCH